MNCFLHRRPVKDLLHLSGGDSGCIEGKVFMIWPPRNRVYRINLEVAEDSALYRFEVEFPHKDGIAFRPHERVSLALMGAKVDQRKESSSPHSFPIILRFHDGVIFKYLSGAHAGQVVDTWEENTDEWYNPGVHTVSDTVKPNIQRSPPADATHSSVSPLPRGGAKDVTVDRLSPQLTAAAEPVVVAQPDTSKPGRLSKRARKRRRMHKEKESTFFNELGNESDKPRRTDVATSHCEQPRGSNNGSSTSDNHSNSHQASGHTNGKVSVREREIDPPCENNNREANIPALQLKAGVCTERGDVFTPINELQISHPLVNVIGVITSVSPEKKTRTNEWSRSFTVVDPSTVDSARQNIRVNCFQKKHLEWLPQVQKNDIIILRKLKIVEFCGTVTATGYSDKLRWAVYDSLNHSVRPPNKGDVPEKEAVDDGMGYEFCPYWEPLEGSAELEYCRQIGEWWKAKHELEGSNVSAVECSVHVSKQHLLISDASPDLPPMGFFNCTIEVLQKFDNLDNATNVYVTDYTASTLVHPVQATWCPPELSDRVLQCTMWDNARNIAKMMNPGEYWYLHNVRAKWNPSHYMEGTIQLAAKVVQLDEAKPDTEPHLKALLERKKEFKLRKSSIDLRSASLHVFPEILLQDVEESTGFFTCIVELLHVDVNTRDGHFIYVSDYTYNPDLPAVISTSDWAHNLEHRAVKIKLDDVQANSSSDLQPGTAYTIHNLRVKRSVASGIMHGYLGGKHTLVVPLHDLSSCQAQTLQRNREKWKRENMLNVLTGSPNGLPKQSSTISESTLQEVLATHAPNVFRVLARVMDFFPFSLEDACVLRCTKCGLIPGPSLKGCPRCDDMMETYCKWFYCLYVLLQDDQGNELIVSLSGKECALLQDVDPADFRCDREARRRFLAKLDPILGNLKEVHVAWSKNEHKVIESPLMIFTLESWNIGNDKGYGLLDCNPA